MGQVAEILSSPDWANKSALEKAAARKDLFAITLEENPEFKEAVVAADEPTRQKLKDDWQAKMTESFPAAFKAPGKDVRRTGKGLTEAEADAPVYDYLVESVLDRLDPKMRGDGSDSDRLNARTKLLESLTPEQKAAVLPIYVQRHGIKEADKLGDVTELLGEDDTLLDKTLGVVAPMAARTIPTLLASPTKNPKLIAASAALGEGVAQGVEQMLGQREGYSLGEGALNAAVNALNPVKMNPGASALVRAGGRALEGAAITGAQNMVQQTLFDDKPPSLEEFGLAVGIGGLLGGGVEGVGTLSSKIKAKLLGKSAEAIKRDLPDLIKNADGADKDALTAIQQRIDEMAGVGRTAPDAAESAARFEQALDAPAPPAASTVLAGRELNQADIDATAAGRAEVFATEMDAAKTPQGAARLREQLTREAAEADRVANMERIAREGTGQDLQDAMRARQAAGPEQIAGESSAAELAARQIRELDAQQATAIKAQLSPQAQRMYDEFGGIRTQVMASIAGGGAGGAAGATQGDTPEEKLENTIKGFLLGAGLSAGAVKLLSGKPTRVIRNALKGEIESAGDDAARASLAAAEAQVAQVESAIQSTLKQLPDDAQVQRLGKKYLVLEGVGEPVEQYQVKLPGEERGRTLTAEQLAAEGYSVPSSPELTPMQAIAMERIASIGPSAEKLMSKYPDMITAIPEGQIPVELEFPDGKRELAVFNGYGEMIDWSKTDRNNPDGALFLKNFPSIGRMTSSGWSHGGIADDVKIVGDIPTPEKWMESRNPAVQSIRSSSGYIDPTLMRSLSSAGSGLAAGAYGLTQGETAEERIKNGLTYSILGAGGGYAAGRMFSRVAQNLPQKSGSPELDKWYKRLGSASTDASFTEKLKNLPNRIRTQLTTSFAPLDKLPQQIAAANNTPLKTPDLPLSRQFELVSGASGKALADAEDYANNVLSKVGDKDWKDFNALLAIKRTGQRLQADQNLQAEQLRIQAIDPAKRTPEETAMLDEAPNRRRVADETLQSVDSALAALENKLGPKRFAELDQLAAGEFQQEADKALRVMVASGRMSQEAYDAIKKSNDFYAPFRVMEYADEFDGFKGVLNNPVDTTRKITHAITGIDSLDFHLDDPANIMAERIYQSRVLAEKNLKMNVLATLANEDASGTVIKKLGHGQSAPRGMETVNYFDKGVPRQLAVSPDVAEAIKGLNPASTGIIANFVRKVNTPFRFGATGGNIGFQAINAPFDLYRQAALSKYGVGRGKPVVDTLRYPLDFIQALYSSVMARPGSATAAGAVTGFYGGYQEGDTQPEKFKNAAVGAIVGGAAGRLAQGSIQRGVGALRNAGMDRAAEALDPNELYRQFYQSGAAGSTLQDMIERVSGDSVRRTIPQSIRGPGIISTLQDFGRAVEETTKLLGFKRGLRIEGIDKLSKQKAYDKLQEVVSETRNFAGSPDFAVAGNAVRDLNAAIVFLNPRIQGMVEDGGRLFGRDGMENAAKAWTALGSSVGLGAAYLWYRNNQPENQADYAQVSPEEKWRNAMIPRYDDKGQPLYFTNERGEKVREYWRIPLRDTAQNFYQMTQSSLDFAQSKDPARVQEFGAELLENLSPINIQGKNAAERMESAISGLGPVGTIPYMLATQRIPGLHREIFRDEEMKKATPENQYTATTPQVYRSIADIMPQFVADPLRSPMMLEQLTQGATGGAFSQFTPQKPLPGRDPSAVAMQQSPLGRRFVRSGYVHNPAPEEAQQAITAQADMRTSQKRTGGQLLDEFTQLQPEERRARYQTLPKEDQQALRKEYINRNNRPSSEEAALIRKMGVENGVRANYLFEQISKREGDARRAYIKALEQDDLLSDNVRKQMSLIYRRQKQAQAARN